MNRDAALGPLGRRLLLSFIAVALLAVALVAGAALVGSSLGLSRTVGATQHDTAQRVADAAATSYTEAGSWETADLTTAQSLATASGARLVVLDASGETVSQVRPGMHAGRGPMGGGGSTTSWASPVSADVRVDGRAVGSVRLIFPLTSASGRSVAWSWILAAAGLAAVAATGAGWFVVRQLTRPLVALTHATRAFGAGDATARPVVRGVGELGELADAFDEAATAVQRSDAVRRQMAADVAHELRTPLSALQAELEELRDGLVPADRATLSRLHDQSLRLGRTVAELGQLSAADAAAADLHLTALDLGELVRAATAAREPQLRAAGVELVTDLSPDVVVRGDGDRLHQVVGNLLDNCATHCRPGDTVHVRLAGAPDGAALIARLEVRDTGPGIPPDDLPHVFERFWRGRDRTTAGSGVGLAVVARLVHAHHGRVDVRSDGRSGTTVVVELPLADTAPERPVATRVGV
ncbi:MAG TPA: HAMP domain-containing sensor histidine kinase [Angustibacter sp.]|nr:HAMP domain-containing sensor histidine kinase [Angustibacter sp.]